MIHSIAVDFVLKEISEIGQYNRKSNNLYKIISDDRNPPVSLEQV